jgi:hypothetical protein
MPKTGYVRSHGRLVVALGAIARRFDAAAVRKRSIRVGLYLPLEQLRCFLISGPRSSSLENSVIPNCGRSP